MTLPFVLLASRAEDAAADEEYESFLRWSGLGARDLIRVRMEAEPVPAFDPDGVAGVILGGSPFTGSLPRHRKSPTQLRVEAELRPILTRVLECDFPFLGVCYGVGTLGILAGGVVDDTHRESTGLADITLTAAGRADDVTRVLPDTFQAFVGHTEAFRIPPPAATILATSPTCPVQMLRIGRNAYITQFHPEMSVEHARRARRR